MPRAPMSEEHKAKLAEGRRKAAEAKREQAAAEATPRVEAYRAWLTADARYHALRVAGENPGPRPKMPPLPSKNDFAIADGITPDPEEDDLIHA